MTSERTKYYSGSLSEIAVYVLAFCIAAAYWEFWIAVAIGGLLWFAGQGAVYLTKLAREAFRSLRWRWSRI